jgi:prevent-host-death family protein
VRRASLAEAKAHLSALVDEAEHHHRRTLILRHGKPAAVLAPVDDAPVRRRLSRVEIRALFSELGRGEHVGAVEDLLASRR